jgi:hypothetical protein
VQLNAVAAQVPVTIRDEDNDKLPPMGDEDGDELPPMSPCKLSGGAGRDGGKGHTERRDRRKGMEQGEEKEEPTRWFPLQPSLVLPLAGGWVGSVEFPG